MDNTTQEQQGKQITVTYRVGSEHQNIDANTARELIRSNAPSGFDVQNVELNESGS